MSDAGIALPSHAYVPGVSPRHDDDAFAALRHTAHSNMSVQELASSEAFRAGLHFFHMGYYWEAHEVLEPVWLATPAASAERHVVQAFIQLANARLKVEMGRRRAVVRLCDMVSAHLAEAGRTGRPQIMGVSLVELKRICDDIRFEINAL